MARGEGSQKNIELQNTKLKMYGAVQKGKN